MGIAAGCTISVILFVLVMEIILKSTDVEGLVMEAPLKAFMNYITVLSEDEAGTRGVLKRLDGLITRSKIKFKAKK